MAVSTAPYFATVPKIGAGSVSTGNTARDGTGGNITTLYTSTGGNAAGTYIESIALKSTGNLADCTVLLYIHDGTSYFLWKEIDVGDPAAGSSTVASYEYEFRVDRNIPDGYSIRLQITVTPTSGVLNGFVFGAAY